MLGVTLKPLTVKLNPYLFEDDKKSFNIWLYSVATVKAKKSENVDFIKDVY